MYEYEIRNVVSMDNLSALRGIDADLALYIRNEFDRTASYGMLAGRTRTPWKQRRLKINAHRKQNSGILSGLK